jgi:hypothetical protein
MKPATTMTTSVTAACRAIVLLACPALAGSGRRGAGRIGKVTRPARRVRIACLLVVSGLLALAPAQGHAAGIECPEVGPGGVPDLLGNEPRFRLDPAANNVDLGNEIDYLINKLQIQKPDISSAELTDVLIAAYCAEVATLPQLTAAEKWRRMRQFDAIVLQQIAANTSAPGTLIIANVPLPPAVFRELRSQAASVNQSPAQLMAAILAQAAGR